MIERIDVVDEQDRVIKSVSRKIAHQKELRHRRSAVLIFKDDSFRQTLLQKRSRSKDICPGKWAHLEGHLLSGENYLQGAKREIEEEMFRGKKIKLPHKLERLFKIKCSLDQDKVFITVYRTILPGPFLLQKEEVSRYKFIDIKELIKEMRSHPRKYTETGRLLFNHYAEAFLHGKRKH